MMLVSIVLTSMIIGRFVVMVQKLSANTTELNERLRKAKEFMVFRKVPPALQAKVRRYLEYQHKTWVHEALDLGFMDRLSPWLRLELTEHMNRGIIQRHPFFQDFPSMLLKRVCSLAKTILCAPGDVV